MYKRQKYPLADYQLMPKMAIVDANNMMSGPKGLTAASGIDAVSHALEAVSYTHLTVTLCENCLVVSINKLVLERGTACVDYENFHYNRPLW